MGSIKRTVRDILDNQIPIANTNSGKKKNSTIFTETDDCQYEIKGFLSG